MICTASPYVTEHRPLTRDIESVIPMKNDMGIFHDRGAKWYTQKYKPPEVGSELAISLIDSPMVSKKIPDRNQPQTSPTGPHTSPMDSVLAMLGSSPMIEKPMPKISQVE